MTTNAERIARLEPFTEPGPNHRNGVAELIAVAKQHIGFGSSQVYVEYALQQAEARCGLRDEIDAFDEEKTSRRYVATRTLADMTKPAAERAEALQVLDEEEAGSPVTDEDTLRWYRELREDPMELDGLVIELFYDGQLGPEGYIDENGVRHVDLEDPPGSF